MTRKDYIAIANVIKWNKKYQPNPKIVAKPVDVVLERVARGLASIMEDDNPNFDYSKFIEACGFNQKQEKDPTCILCDHDEEHEH